MERLKSLSEVLFAMAGLVLMMDYEEGKKGIKIVSQLSLN
jgi:hypothetical protein